MQADESYLEKRNKIDPAKKQLWINEQKYIRKLIVKTDQLTCLPKDLKLVAGVDVSFSGKFQNGACTGLVIFDCQQKKIVYEDYEYVKLKEQYIPGFLAFRELPPTLALFSRLKQKKPQLYPQLVLVDGNGILHKYECGYACHLGVVLGLPSIGCAKSFFDVDGLHQQQVENWLNQELSIQGESIILKGKSGREWCSAILADQQQNSHIFVSIGTGVSLSTATEIVKQLLKRQTAEPVRLADKNSRAMIRKMTKKHFQQALSYEMDYLS